MFDSISYYDNADCDFIATTVNLDMTATIHPFLSLIKKGGLILDIGCGSGRDSKYFIEQGYKVIAIEPSLKNREFASKLIGQEVLNLKAEDIDFENLFDGVWACASLLHSDKSDLKLIFNKIYTALKPEGILYTSFKCRANDFINNGRYFTCFTKEELEKFIKENTQFKLLKSYITVDIRENRPNEEWVNILIQKG